jgi:hypothetical protein
MRILFLTISSITLLSFSTSNALANADTPEACALIESPAKRLSCYDSLFRQANDKTRAMKSFVNDAKNNTVSENDSRRTSRADAVTKNLTDTRELEDVDTESRLATVQSDKRNNTGLVTEVARPPETSKPAQSISDSTKAPEERFGAERIQKDDVFVPDDVSFTISTITENQRKVRTFTFSNDQVWREISKNRLRVREGDTVTISKGTFTSYYLSKEGVNRKTQVKRIR